MTGGNYIIRDPFSEAFIEYKVLAEKLIGNSHFFGLSGIFDNSTIQLINIFIAPVFHIRRSFFTTNTSGAIHDDMFLLGIAEHFCYHRESVTKCFHRRQDCFFEMPDFTFIIVTHIDHDRIRIIGELIERRG